MTVHPDTMARFEVLRAKYRLPRGQVVDKLVAAFCNGLNLGCRTCAGTGEPCRMQLKDVPEVL